MVEELALLTVAVAALYFLLTGLLSLRTGSKYKRYCRTEQTRTYWAEARDLLTQLVRDGKLDASSNTFRTFYGVQTFIMRRPEQYRDISEAMAQAFLLGPHTQAPSWRDEIDTWPEEMGTVLRYMSAGTGNLLFRHKGWKKLLPALLPISVWISKRAGRGVADRVRRWIPIADATRKLALVQNKMDQLTGAFA